MQLSVSHVLCETYVGFSYVIASGDVAVIIKKPKEKPIEKEKEKEKEKEVKPAKQKRLPPADFKVYFLDPVRTGYLLNLINSIYLEGIFKLNMEVTDD